MSVLKTNDPLVQDKKPRNGALADEQKAANQQFSSGRVHVEHGIRRVKAFRILREAPFGTGFVFHDCLGNGRFGSTYSSGRLIGQAHRTFLAGEESVGFLQRPPAPKRAENYLSEYLMNFLATRLRRNVLRTAYYWFFPRPKDAPAAPRSEEIHFLDSL